MDRMFRPSFSALLSTLTTLHSVNFCHDDIKPANIFISEDPLHWLLGDFGNVREKQHVYHQSKVWKQQNQWEDCEENDERRLRMVYLSFLRSLHNDTGQFDREFLEKREGWTRVYWDFMESNGAAQTSEDSGLACRSDVQGSCESAGG
ncbi:hypothetical protein E4T38_03257 [Aureobasidium subglaciale]|nr:hypothetical protein E4T38_03257 [Aureobasidium subglaciale]KAI5226538.1 hypothetical protein E4T40_03031 [Aureobasidium subglaciale]KAI5229939.1 hypothetical protein E4T41_03254 [Aureobasidium subglaciale]KAI5264478.1 hypothetical protein E4T46_03032 [Aureobasidium subglaciale]